MPVSQIPAALSIGTFSSSASRLFVFFKNIRFGIVLYFVPPAIIAVFIGAFLLKYLNPIYIQVMMGLFLVSHFSFIFKKNKNEALEQVALTKSKIIGVGFLTGFLSGLTGAVGLLFNKFYLRHGLSKNEIIATRAANEIILHLIKFILYALLGLITIQVLQVGAVVALAALSSTFLIKYILPLISTNAFKKIGYSAMVISGLMMLIQSSNTIFIENKGQLSFSPVAEGIETKLQWQNADYTLEFTYDEGFEFEQIIPFNELDSKFQTLVKQKQGLADRLVIEKVYTMEGIAYEAYYFKGNQLINKIDLE